VTASPTLLLAEHLIDGTSTPPRERAALLLRNGRIEAVTAQADLTRTQREGAAVLDLGEATVLPGLIDTHVHLTFNAGLNHEIVRRAVASESDARLAVRALANSQAHLAAGVTTLRDVGGRGYVTLSLRDAIRDGLAVGPRMQASGPAITTPRGHLNYLGAIAQGAEELRRAATEVLDAGADFVKLCATGGIMTAESDPMAIQYTAEELREAVQVAEARNTLVAAHVLASEALDNCIQAGVRSIEHCFFQDEPGVFRFRPEWAARMIERNIFAGLTFAGISQVRYQKEVLGVPDTPDMGIWQERLKHRFQTERELVASGVPYVLHSDAGVRETRFGDFWLVVAAGAFELELSPLEALRAVTATPAALMGLSDEVGTLEPGKRADLLVTEHNPAEGLEALRSPKLVLLNGRIVAREGELCLPGRAPG
jgi:imidazolonepropionase-like amidohydrolase